MKNRTFLLAFVCILLVSGCTLIPGRPQSAQDTQTPQANQQQENKGDSGNVITSLKNALSLGQSMKCTYTDDETEVTTLIKGSKVRVDGIDYQTEDNTTVNGVMINDGEWVYVWSDVENVGLKFSVTNMMELGENSEATDWSDPSTWAEEIDSQHQVACTPTVVDDSQFVPPANIAFEDMAAMLDFAKQMQDAKITDFENMPLPGDMPVDIPESE